MRHILDTDIVSYIKLVSIKCLIGLLGIWKAITKYPLYPLRKFRAQNAELVWD